MERRNLILGGIAVAGLGGWAISRSMDNSSVPANPLASAANAQSTDGPVQTGEIAEMVAGNPDATVTMIEYASFTCPHCARFHEGPYQQLKADYIDTGKIKFIYREIYFDRYGLWASMIARCNGGDRFFGIADLIYKGQSQWTRAGEPAAIVDELRKIGRLAGLDSETIEGCLQNPEMAQSLVAWDEANRTADGITATPSFVINGRKQPNMAYPELQRILDDALNG